MKPISKVFIANRAEILRRIALSCKKNAIQTVCIKEKEGPLPNYLDHLIDEFVMMKKDSNPYLNIPLLIRYAKEHNCDSVHPGFGFLSENEEFAKAVEAAGMTWVGPSPHAIKSLGDKAESRHLAQKCGVPCTPVMEILWGKEPLSEVIKNISKTMTFPLLVKAAFGGGGKGIRIAYNETELKESLERAASEAKKSFGNDKLLVEPYIEKARHIEVQVLGDSSGGLVTLGTRDCSFQRRYQKIIEEAPACFLSQNTIKNLEQSALRLAREVAYSSAGTVEFIMPWDDSMKDKQDQPFYFLEMNTRLQVEHTVTEEIFGVDLVDWQLKIANGEKVPDQSVFISKGHSIQARIYAEDVEKNFLPCAGSVDGFFPYYSHRVRWELGLDTFDEISLNYDPMVAKLIVYDESRQSALIKLHQTLQRTYLGGVSNNKELLMWYSSLTSLTQFTTKWLEQNKEIWTKELVELKATNEKKSSEILDSLKDIAIGIFFREQVTDLFDMVRASAFFEEKKSTLFQIKEISHKNLTLESSNSEKPHLITRSSYGVLEFSFCDKIIQSPFVFIFKNQKIEIGINFLGFHFKSQWSPKTWDLKDVGAVGNSLMTAPVPGKVVKISVIDGENIPNNHLCFILESMKMEFEIRSSSTLKVLKILVQPGQQVAAGQKLFDYQL